MKRSLQDLKTFAVQLWQCFGRDDLFFMWASLHLFHTNLAHNPTISKSQRTPLPAHKLAQPSPSCCSNSPSVPTTKGKERPPWPTYLTWLMTPFTVSLVRPCLQHTFPLPCWEMKQWKQNVSSTIQVISFHWYLEKGYWAHPGHVYGIFVTSSVLKMEPVALLTGFVPFKKVVHF